MQNRKFTPSEAEKMLPLVRSIVKDILVNGKKLKSHLSRDEEDSAEVAVLRENLERLLKELEGLGCFFKDWNFEIGLVDFPSEIDGEAVLLCWRSDEEHISHFHSFVGGYSDRRVIPPELLKHLPTPSESV